MKGRIGCFILSLFLLLTASTGLAEEGGFVRNSRDIPDELAHIPEEYRQPSEHPGTLEKLTYETWDSLTYDQHTTRLTKEAWVYIPYGYDPAQKYNIFYISHGGWSNETSTLGTAENPKYLKYAIDHAIEDGLMMPIIIVCPTYNNLSPQDSSNSIALTLVDHFHNELLYDLIPAAEGKYHTYADYDTTLDGQRASRDHRGFGGFSMGSVNTWHTFEYCLDSFRYFMPMSGSMGDGGWARNEVLDSDWTDQDFFIWAATGSADFAGSSFSGMINSMATRYSDVFHLADNETDGNLSFRMREGGDHDEEANFDYTWNALCWFWNTED